MHEFGQPTPQTPKLALIHEHFGLDPDTMPEIVILESNDQSRIVVGYDTLMPLVTALERSGDDACMQRAAELRLDMGLPSFLDTHTDDLK